MESSKYAGVEQRQAESLGGRVKGKYGFIIFPGSEDKPTDEIPNIGETGYPQINCWKNHEMLADTIELIQYMNLLFLHRFNTLPEISYSSEPPIGVSFATPHIKFRYTEFE